MLPWMVMEVIRAVTVVVHQEDPLRSTHLLLRDHPAKVVLLLLIKAFNKAVTRTQVPIKTIPKSSIFDLKGTRCRSKESLINLTRRDRTTRLTRQTLTGDILVETCRRIMPADRIYTTDTPVVNNPAATQPERHPTQEVTAIHPRRKHIHLTYRNRQLPANPLRLLSLPPLRPILALKTTTDRNRVDTELLQGHKYIRVVRLRTKICHRHHRVQIHLDVTPTLPKTNSIPSITSNDQRIQDGQTQPISTTAVVGTIGFSIRLRNHRHKRRSSNNSRSNQRHQ